MVVSTRGDNVQAASGPLVELGPTFDRTKKKKKVFVPNLLHPAGLFGTAAQGHGEGGGVRDETTDTFSFFVCLIFILRNNHGGAVFGTLLVFGVSMCTRKQEFLETNPFC